MNEIRKYKGNSNRFHELDVLRGVAALAVVVFHYSGHCTRYFSDFPFNFTYGKYGVQLFFVISGFVIYFTLDKSKNWRDFAFSRFGRLFPAYWATLALLMLNDIILNNNVWWGGYAVNLTMLQKFLGYLDIDIVFWSLAVELNFYVIMGILFTTRAIQKITTITLIWLLIAGLNANIKKHLGMPFLSDLISTYLILDYAPYFIVGMMFYLIKRGGLKKEQIAIIFCAFITIYINQGMQTGIIAIIIFTIFALATAGVLNFTISRSTLWLGTISYPLYLVHRNLGYEALFRLDHFGVSSTLSFTLVLAGSLLLSSILAYSVEQPAMKALRSWYQARKKDL